MAMISIEDANSIELDLTDAGYDLRSIRDHESYTLFKFDPDVFEPNVDDIAEVFEYTCNSLGLDFELMSNSVKVF